MGAAFRRTSKSVNERAGLLREGKAALESAALVIEKAVKAQQTMDKEHPSGTNPGTWTRPVGPLTEEDLDAQRKHQAKVNEYQENYASAGADLPAVDREHRQRVRGLDRGHEEDPRRARPRAAHGHRRGQARLDQPDQGPPAGTGGDRHRPAGPRHGTRGTRTRPPAPDDDPRDPDDADPRDPDGDPRDPDDSGGDHDAVDNIPSICSDPGGTGPREPRQTLGGWPGAGGGALTRRSAQRRPRASGWGGPRQRRRPIGSTGRTASAAPWGGARARSPPAPRAPGAELQAGAAASGAAVGAPGVPAAGLAAEAPAHAVPGGGPRARAASAPAGQRQEGRGEEAGARDLFDDGQDWIDDEDGAPDVLG